MKKKTSGNNDIYKSIYEKILSGEYPAGYHLVEMDLAAEYHVSRTPVRLAIERLVAEGLAKHVPHKGAVVRRMTRTDILNMFAVREVTEGLAARLASQHVTEEDRICLLYTSVSEMGKLARKYNLLFVVDNVSALACMPFQMDDWGVDAVVTASQKGLMSPVGMSFVAMSKRAFAACERNQSKDFYINFKSIRKFLETKKETPGSTPVSVTLSVHEALNMIYEEGIENTFHRHAAISQGTKAALQALGFSLYPAQCQTRSDSLTVAQVPQGIHAKSLVKLMRDEYGIMIGGGLGDMGSTHVRVAHMGYCYVEDMLQCITVMEAALEALGCPEQMGKGTAAFLRAYRGAL